MSHQKSSIISKNLTNVGGCVSHPPTYLNEKYRWVVFPDPWVRVRFAPYPSVLFISQSTSRFSRYPSFRRVWGRVSRPHPKVFPPVSGNNAGGVRLAPHLNHAIVFHDKADPFQALLSKSKRVSLRSPFSLTTNFLKYPSYPASSFLHSICSSRRSYDSFRSSCRNLPRQPPVPPRSSQKCPRHNREYNFSGQHTCRP